MANVFTYTSSANGHTYTNTIEFTSAAGGGFLQVSTQTANIGGQLVTQESFRGVVSDVAAKVWLDHDALLNKFRVRYVRVEPSQPNWLQSFWFERFKTIRTDISRV